MKFLLLLTFILISPLLAYNQERNFWRETKEFKIPVNGVEKPVNILNANNGNVGIGSTGIPQAQLHVNKKILLSHINFTPTIIFPGIPPSTQSTAAESIFEIRALSSSKFLPYLPGQDQFYRLDSDLNSTVSFKAIADHKNNFRLFSINTESPNTPIVFSMQNDEKVRINSNGNVGIGTDSPKSLLHVNGITTTKVITITGGTDIAEPFQINENMGMEATPGSVVVIDDMNPGKLKLSSVHHDKRVVGVISGANGINPGIKLTQTEKFDSGELVAIAGRVYVRANCDNGDIMPGDFLTSSSIPGEAMKVTNFNEAQGAIIGKAMTRIENGYVLILVSLQ